MTASGISHEPRRYWLITSPRTASNLLVKILNLDAQGARQAWNGGYFWMKSTKHRLALARKPFKEWTDEELDGLVKIQQECFDDLQNFIEEAEKEKQIIFVKEHAVMLNNPYFENRYDFGAHGAGTRGPIHPSAMRGSDSVYRSALNLTSVPDEFLKTWFPTFLIRHPGLMLPSFYRAALKDFGMAPGEAATDRSKSKDPTPSQMSMQFVRELYDFYANHFATIGGGENSADTTKWPLVLDADDVMQNPELVTKYASLASLDPEKLLFSWDKKNPNDMSTSEKVMLGSLSGSTGVDKSKIAGNVDVTAEAVKWRAEFGEEGGIKMEKWVRECMPDYEYMYSRRLKLED